MYLLKMEYLHTHTRADPGWSNWDSIPNSEQIIANGSKKILVLLYSNYVVVPGIIQQYKYKQTSHGMEVSKVISVPESDRKSIDSIVRRNIRGVKSPYKRASTYPMNFWR
jgi:hypothetical protein|tara:strand:+ start:4812 stop:5141 length:330 start_codon:yes stop_codon:yes gene_type:complete